MEIKNILLTGEIKVGKSTIINKIIENYYKKKLVAGFKTLPIFKDDTVIGYYIEDQLDKDIDISLDNTVGRVLDKEKRCYGIEDTFEKKGVEILVNALNLKCDLILLDELGFFENNALNFKEKVNEVFESNKRVIGVLKKKDTEFLSSIKNRKDVLIIEVNKENRAYIEERIREYWKL